MTLEDTIILDEAIAEAVGLEEFHGAAVQVDFADVFNANCVHDRFLVSYPASLQ